MVNITPVYVNEPATKIAIIGFECHQYPVVDNVVMITVGYFDENNVMLKKESVPLLKIEYDQWAAGEIGEEYIMSVCIQKLDIETII